MTYEDVMRQLEEKAKENRCERWLYPALSQIDAGQHAPSDA